MKKKRRERINKIIIVIVSITMLFSGIWLFSRTNQQNNSNNSNYNLGLNLTDINKYNVNEIGTIIVNITKVNDRIVIIPERGCINPYIIAQIENISLLNVINKSYEIANPKIYKQIDTICGLYIFLNFDLSGNGSVNISNDTLDLMKGIVGEFGVYRVYTGRPVQNVSYIGEIPFIANLGARIGDYYEISLLQKSVNKKNMGVIGLMRNSVAKGPIVPAEVMKINEISINAIAPYNISKDYINKKINTTGIISIHMQKPKIIVNRLLDNETLERIRNVSGVDFISANNRTSIVFNNSEYTLKKLMNILHEENVSIEEGRVILIITPESDISKIKVLLSDIGVYNITLNKIGYVSVPDVVVIKNDVIFIKNSDNLDCILGMNTTEGDRINISLNTIDYGGGVIVTGSEEIL